jgi:hypothetical protein
MSAGDERPIRVSYALFLDDERQPPKGDWIIVRSYDEAVAYVTAHGMPTTISFDHDLGLGPSGHAFAHWLIEHHLDGHPLPADFEFVVHSMNPVGAANITALLRPFLLLIGR